MHLMLAYIAFASLLGAHSWASRQAAGGHTKVAGAAEGCGRCGSGSGRDRSTQDVEPCVEAGDRRRMEQRTAPERGWLLAARV